MLYSTPTSRLAAVTGSFPTNSNLRALARPAVAALALACLLIPSAHAAVDQARHGISEGAVERAPLPDQALNFGVIIQTFAAPDIRPAGLGFDGTHLWLVTDTKNAQTIWKLDPADGSVVDSFPAQTGLQAFGLDHDGGALWGDTFLPTQLYAADPNDGAMLLSLPTPLVQPNGTTWDGADLWQSAFGEDLALVDETDGSLIRTIPAPGDQGAPRDMAWDGTTLWVVDANATFDDAVHQIDPADGSVMISFIPQGDPLDFIFGLAWDGQFLWMTDLLDNQIHKIDLGLHVGVWLNGVCPGPVQLDVDGETPDGRYAIVLGSETGFSTVPSGECEGISLGVADPTLLRISTGDANGDFTLGGNLNAGICGSYLQVLDLETCLPSAVARLPQ